MDLGLKYLRKEKSSAKMVMMLETPSSMFLLSVRTRAKSTPRADIPATINSIIISV